MRRLLPLIYFLIGALLLAGLPPIAAAQPAVSDVRVTQVDTSRYPEVTLYVAATDAAGQPRGGLRRADFAVTEDGTPVEISAFDGGGGAMAAALVLDRSRSMEERDKLRGAQDAARAFVQQMRPGDRTTLVSFHSRIRSEQPLTGQRDVLLHAVDRLRANGGTALYDAVIAGVDALASAEGRRVLLLLTDGQDCRDVPEGICPDAYGSDATLDEAIAYANQHEQPLYVVGLGERGHASSDERGINETVLQRLAADTYGDYFYAPRGDELAALYTRLASSVQNEYRLTYTSPRPFYDGTRRDIRVSVGGAASSGGYVERHLINVQSNPLVGLLLLLPLVGLLLLPTLARRTGWRPAWPLGQRRRNGAADPQAARSVPVEDAAADTADTADSTDDSSPGTPPETRSGAAPAASTTTATRTASATHRFCHQCGTPLRPGSRFCGQCGAQTGTGDNA
jgi:VWFA-related protein